MKNYILVTGGAGFIGSYVEYCLRRKGFSTLVLDDLSRGVWGPAKIFSWGMWGALIF